jgi:hypothetical protein
MRVLRTLQQLCAIILVVVAGAASGCGGGGAGAVPMVPMVPITVSLNPSTVVVAPGGTPGHAQITIGSTSETALVNFSGLPAGISEMYASTDTNPSGLLTFTATKSAVDGTYMPMVIVNSAGQTASLNFTLIVRSAGTAATRF